ncbi:MAG: protein kinase [Lentisphaerales bacterium]|nr:protein kinase [Lentisphaerales bacterium]
MDNSKSDKQVFESMKKGFGRFYQQAKEESNSEQSKIDYEIDRIKAIRQDSSRYSQSRIHAQGGMKKIIRSTDRLTYRQIAIAKMKAEKFSISDLKMFLHEARILARLNHPNIVPIHDIGVDQQNQPYFTMKLLSGESLGEILDKLRAKEEEYVARFPLPRLLEIFIKICDATAFAHSRNIVHRDLKPDNVQVGDFGEVLLCDWGLAKDINLPNQSTEEIKISEIIERQTLNGTIKGTPGYMAPEQVDDLAEITEKTDIYALGCILYSIITLEKSIDSSDLDTIVDSITTGDIVPPHLRVSDNVPKALEAVTLKAMSVAPDKRYESPNEIASEIKAYLDGFATDAQKADFKTQIYLLIKRNKTISTLIFCSFLIIATLVSYFLIELKKREAMALDAMKEAQFQKSAKDNLGHSVAPDFYNKAIEELKAYNFKQAINFARICTELDNSYIKGWSLLGKLQIGRHDFSGALQVFQKGNTPSNQKLAALCQELQKNQNLTNDAILSLLTHSDLKNILPFFINTLYQNMSIENKNKMAIDLFKQLNKSNGARIEVQNSINWKIVPVNFKKVHQQSLELLHGLEVKSLDLSSCPAFSLKVLSSLPLETLNLSNSKFLNLNPLKDIKLKGLNISHTQITDLKILRNQPLEILDISNSAVKDINILLKLRNLKTLTISKFHNDKQNIVQFLRKKGVEVVIKE